MTRRQALRGGALAAGGLAAAALIGCGDEDDGGGDSTAEATGTASGDGTGTATESAGSPQRGGKLTWAEEGDPPTWSVYTASGTTVAYNGYVYDKLVDAKTGPGTDPYESTVIPQIAEDLPEQPDETTYVFKVRQGVKFQNVDPVNGRDMTIEDVVFAIDNLRQQGSFQRDYAAVTSVTAVDDTTLEVKTSEPYAPLLNFASGQYGWRIFPRELVEGDLLDNTAVGTGPYIVEDWQQASRTIFRRNPDYWNDQTAWIDEIEYLVIPAAESRLSAFETGQIDVLEAGADLIACVASEDLAARAGDSINTQAFDDTSGWLAFNTTVPPFDDVRVRQAIALLYNREAERQALYCGQSSATGLLPLPRALNPMDFPEAADYLRLDVDEAKKLLSAAGYADGFQTTAVWTPQYGEVYAQALERIIGDFAEAGVELAPESYEYGVWIADIYRGSYNFDGILWGPGRYYADADPYVAYWLHPDGIANQSRVNDPEMTALIEQQRRQLNEDERWETLHEIQRLEASNMYYVWREAGLVKLFTQKRVHDLVGHAAYDEHEMWHAWVDA